MSQKQDITIKRPSAAPKISSSQLVTEQQSFSNDSEGSLDEKESKSKVVLRLFKRQRLKMIKKESEVYVELEESEEEIPSEKGSSQRIHEIEEREKVKKKKLEKKNSIFNQHHHKKKH